MTSQQTSSATVKCAPEPLLRQLTWRGIWLLAVNGMIGAGIFGVPAGAAALTGVWSPLLFVACGILLGAVVLCFAELASYFRGTGGPILYARAAFGPLVGMQTGWAFYIARVTAFAANVNLLVASIAFFWPQAGGGAIRIALLAAIVGLLTWINVLGVRQAMRSIGALTVLKFLPLVLLAVLGASSLGPAAFPLLTADFPEWGEWASAVLLVVYAFVGWEAAVVPAGESRNPSRDMPRALFWALGVVTVLYVAIQAVAVALLPDLATSERPLMEAGAALLGPAGAMLMTAGVVVSVGGNVASAMFTAPRLTYSLAREGSLPAWFGQVHPTHRTPHRSILFFGALAFGLAAYGSFVWLAAMSALVRVLIYMLCIGAMPKLRRSFGGSADAYRVPGGWLIPIGAFATCGILLTQVRFVSILVTLLFLIAGAVLYWGVRRGA